MIQVHFCDTVFKFICLIGSESEEGLLKISDWYLLTVVPKHTVISKTNGTLYLMYAFYKLTKAILKLNVRYKELLLTVFWTAVLLIIFASNFSFEFWLLYAFLINIEENKSRVENA